MNPADLANPNSIHVQNALTFRCQICGAKPGNYCKNTIKPKLPLPGGRLVHIARTQP
jgi:hypothetical protein